ncbi:glycoside hydrolase family 3 N-terminal domain-containing protein [Streptomyces griseiscabiei]|uniref:Glycoside hydrolase family 3 N-terminal domain-containing protein n=1 Tax=Streptomyces griseiscabiei TaxID=2993540 RepID=A0ABU4LC61_9ACTN|nr:glycoside hydrolase family 3 N-terminal domain-containing protein [Streptomyces griseiscabiei]MDX2913198.1 glycoside hydrolase family 3 N-terminal domain-containing protein [Streptomyces griseiscabiei]
MTASARTHRDTELSADVRAGLLLREMTLEEKCGQLSGAWPWTFVDADGSDADGVDTLLRCPPGHVPALAGDDPARLVRLVGAIQHQFVTRTRLGIPVLIHQEALNGFMTGGHMVFPTPVGLAATFSPDLVEEMSDLIRGQMRRLGFVQALSPVMDVALDPRWGRVHETYGEDPYLCAAFSVAYTRGLQGDDLTRGVIATAKHFVGYGLAAGGINLSAYEGGARATRDLFAHPFEAAIRLAGLGSVMNSYADVDGVPVGISREVLTGLLRDTLGFDGFVSSDYSALDHVVTRQRAAATPGEAARLGILAGLDVELPTPYAYGTLVDEVRRGALDERDVDTCVLRVLRAKFALGLFENPYPQEGVDLVAAAGEGKDLSHELARRSVVLAKNEGVLPLSPRGLTVAVIGPHADAAALQFPTYTYPAWRDAALAMGRGEMINMVGAEAAHTAWNDGVLSGADTAGFVRERYGARSLSEEIADLAGSVLTETGSTLTRPLDQDQLDRAVDAATRSDVVVLALGGASLWFNGERTEGEGSDSADISLPDAQTRLAEAVAATGKPLVVVLFQGRAYALPDVVKNAAAIVVAPYGGPFGPKSVAEVLFGTVNPGGKLPYSIPRHTGQIPVYHHQKTGTGYRNPLPPGTTRLYLDMEATPLYPFGHGLSYTDFALGALASDDSTDTSGAVRIATTVTNTGGAEGAAVVQLYVRINTSGVTRPAQQLAGFRRVDLRPGESRRVTFEVRAAQLGHTGAARDFAVEPARVDFFLGFDSDDRRVEGAFEVLGRARVLASGERAFLSEAVVERV